ncbi:hypothetical protein C0992_003518 [Termitomyces sp. T32_za158]|nr:hypothetical protein C0992_003518 [Termitomyces sp. T32_za158]
MFTRLATVVLLALPAIMALPSSSPSDSCSGGTVMCCNDASESEPSPNQGILGTLLGLGLGDLNVPVNVNCVPVSVLGADGESCAGQVACCSNNNVNALVALDCTPLNVSV